MNEKLNLVEILKDCPKGTKLYSPVYGYVELVNVSEELVCISQNEDISLPIKIKLSNNCTDALTKDGRLFVEYDGECMLFPSKEERDWSKFELKKPKFDPKTLKPFDKVLVRDMDLENWKVQLFSNIIEYEKQYPFLCIKDHYMYFIPYNDDTNHLIGTKEEAPEFYRYWNK